MQGQIYPFLLRAIFNDTVSTGEHVHRWMTEEPAEIEKYNV
jgi:hypothetical protein